VNLQSIVASAFSSTFLAFTNIGSSCERMEGTVCCAGAKPCGPSFTAGSEGGEVGGVLVASCGDTEGEEEDDVGSNRKDVVGFGVSGFCAWRDISALILEKR
jgi:hypothetical protein